MKNNRTMWIRFLRNTVTIGFALIIFVGMFLSFIKGNLLVGLLGTAVAILIAFLVCSAAFIKLDMAEDVHALRQAVGSEDLRLIRQAMEYFLVKSRMEGFPNPAEHKVGVTGQAQENAATVPTPGENPPAKAVPPGPEK